MQRVIEFRNYYRYSVVVLFCLKVGENMIFTINNRIWNVVFVNANSDLLRRSDGSITVGVADGGTNCVYLSNFLRGSFLRKVFIHEVCHVAVFSYGISLTLEQEEFLCDFIATYGDEIFAIVDDLFMALKKVG